jgi:hypothetical protein
MKAHGHQDRANGNNVRPTRHPADCPDKPLFRKVRPETVNIRNVKNQPPPRNTSKSMVEKISAVTLRVANMRASVRFYKDVLGLGDHLRQRLRDWLSLSVRSGPLGARRST